jgi:RNA polymerase sigma-70 factor, ECF subfamily
MIAEDVTELLLAWQKGDGGARDRLVPLVHGELRKIARRCLSKESVAHTLQPTALVNEAYLRLINQNRADWHSRTHFFAVAASLMRRILVDHARARSAAKRWGGFQKLPLDEALDTPLEPRDLDLVALDQALEKLKSIDEQQCRIVELRFFGGLTVEETAAVLAVSPITIHRRWQSAKLFLRRELEEEAKDD